jgi:putative transposase
MKETYTPAAGNAKQKTTANRERTEERTGWEQRLENGRLTVQLPLPMIEALADTSDVIERMSREVGLLIAKAVLDDEVERKAGARHARTPEAPYRWGAEDGYLVFGGQKVPLERPRLRQGGKEVRLEAYGRLNAPPRMEGAVDHLVVRGVSTRNYQGAVEGFLDSYGIRKSSVSRHFVAASAKQLAELCERPLSALKLAVIVLDGKVYEEATIIVGLGIDETGRKHVLGLWDGATESAETAGGLLKDLHRRGLDLEREYLFVIDGSKALARAIRAQFGAEALVQRCQLHKRRNVKDHLPKKWQGVAEQRLKVAYGLREYEEAREALQKTVHWLRTLSEGAARSLEEGLEETLTLHKLGLPDVLRKTLSSTNVIESCFSHVQHLTRNVKRWRDAQMVRRWVGGMLLVAEKKFRRVRGHKSMPLLLNVLCPQSAVAVRAVEA